MADNVTLPAAAGKAATDEVSFSGDTAQVQLVRVVNVDGAEGSKTVRKSPDMLIVDVSSSGLTTVTTTYSSNDQLGALMTIANAAAESDGVGHVVGLTLIDASDVIGPVDAVLFDSSVTLGSDNAAFSISDADAAKIVAYVPLVGAIDLGSNRICFAQNLRIPYKCAGGTSLYCALITRSNNGVFAAGATSLTLRVAVERL